MPNHAAYTPADVEDARRGHPATDLTGYGQARGLEPVGHALLGHLAGLGPVWPEYVFNVLRGELVPGRFGAVQHELHEVGLGDDGEPSQPGTYHGRRTVSRPGWGSLVGLHRTPPNEPFAAQAMWLPTTSIRLLVPEAAVLPRIHIATSDHMVLSDRRLDPWAPSFRMSSSRFIGTELRDAVAASVGPALQVVGTTFARLEAAHGAVGLTVDGYRHDPADLDRLVAVTGAVAQALVELGRPWWAPAPFDRHWGAFDRSTHPAGYRSFETDHDRSGLDALERDATATGMVVEDPVALHRRFPRLPIPGTSMGVLAGTLPGTGARGRLTWQTQSHPGSSSYLRRGAVVAARPDAPATPVGGALLPTTDMYAAVVDGLACCWTRTNSPGRLDTDELAARAVATFRETGLGAV